MQITTSTHKLTKMASKETPAEAISNGVVTRTHSSACKVGTYTAVED